MKFESKTLKEVSGGGSYGLGASASQTPIGPKFLRTTDIVRGTIDWDDVPYCHADSSTIEKYRLHENDIVISRTGANAGINCLVNKPPVDAIFAGYLVRFQIDEKIANAHYVSYVLRSLVWGDYVANTRTGSAQPQLNAVLMGEFEFSLPPLHIQKVIAQVLGALDEKFELNQQISKNLEGIAQTIFRSWFVDFDPVKAKMAGEKPVGMDDETAALFPDSMVGSELGLVPVGWKLSSIGDEIECVGGSTPSTSNSEFWDGDIFWTTPKDLSKQVGLVTTSSERQITNKGLQKISSGLLPVHSVLMSSRAPIGYLSINAVPTAINQGFIALRHDPKFAPLYLFFWLQLNMPEIKNRAGGGTFAEISRSAFKSIPFVVPNEPTLRKFAEIAEPILSQLTALSLQNQELAALRDALLPRLISGELQIPEVMLVP